MLRGLVLIFCIFFATSPAFAEENGTQCAKNIRADVLFILDGSISIGVENFKQHLLGAVTKFIKQVKIGPEHVSIGVMVFGDDVTFEVEPSRIQTPFNIARDMQEIVYPEGYSALGDALAYAAENGFADLPKRPDTKRVAIVFTDGYSNFGDEVLDTAPQLKKVVDRVLVVGIGRRVRQREMNLMVKNPKTDIVKKRNTKQAFNFDLAKWWCTHVDRPSQCPGKKQQKETLVFSIKAKHTTKFDQVWNSSETTAGEYQSVMNWYIHKMVKKWTTGRFQTARLVLERSKMEVMSMQFDTQSTNITNFMDSKNLLSAFPFDVTVLKKQGFLRSFENIFSICPNDHGYFGGFIHVKNCSRKALYIRPPSLLYTLRTDSKPGIFDSYNTKYANELKLYVAGYTTHPLAQENKRADQYQIVYRLHSGAQIGSYDLYTGNLYSAQHYLKPTDIPKSSLWYKSPLIRQWPNGKVHSVQLRLLNRRRRVIDLIFDAKNSNRFGWFKKENLIKTYPWTLNYMKKQNFTMFSIAGDRSGEYARSFVIAEKYDPRGCSPRQRGWLMVLDRKDKCVEWSMSAFSGAFSGAFMEEKFMGPVFRYNPRPTYGWTHAPYAYSLEILVRLLG